MWQTFCEVAAAGNASLHDSNTATPTTAATTDWFQLFEKVKGVFQTFVYFIINCSCIIIFIIHCKM